MHDGRPGPRQLPVRSSRGGARFASSVLPARSWALLGLLKPVAEPDLVGVAALAALGAGVGQLPRRRCAIGLSVKGLLKVADRPGGLLPSEIGVAEGDQQVGTGVLDLSPRLANDIRCGALALRRFHLELVPLGQELTGGRLQYVFDPECERGRQQKPDFLACRSQENPSSSGTTWWFVRH